MLPKNGRRFLHVLVISFLFLGAAGCPPKKDHLPPLLVCIHEGEAGGADCVGPTGQVSYLEASQLQGANVYLADDHQKLIDFCFDLDQFSPRQKSNLKANIETGLHFVVQKIEKRKIKR